ncbi:MAG: 1,4-alpha-glucan branching protein domain-containing protein [Candidatus Hodarchaeota archaeon]
MSFALALHAHIPYCKKSGTWPAGEEWLHEAIIESYLPILRTLERLKSESIPINMNIEFTPILLEQLADSYMQEKFVIYLEDLLKRAESDVHRFSDSPVLKQTAEYYLEDYTYFLEYYTGTIKRDVIGAYRKLQDDGLIEIFTSAATHGFLPLLERDSSIWSQLKIGVDTYKKHFGKQPQGIWLPECAFRPMKDGRAGIDYWLKKAGIRYFIVNYTGFDQADLTWKNPGGPGYVSTYEAYKLAGTGVHTFGRNFNTSKRVWSAKVGYPGNPVYREFHVKDSTSGLRYLAISEREKSKKNYDIQLVDEQLEADARDFSTVVAECLDDYRNLNQRDGIIVSPYDFELFGHWWHEGPEWLYHVYKTLAERDDIEVTAIGDYLGKNQGSCSEFILKPTTWGEGGDFRVWKNPQHEWIWPYINSSARDFEDVLASIGEPRNDLEARVLKQIARELLLMEGSDWPFLLYTKQALEYANQRFHWHHQRYNKLIWAAKDFSDAMRLNMQDFEEIASIDDCFEDIDLTLFRERRE